MTAGNAAAGKLTMTLQCFWLFQEGLYRRRCEFDALGAAT